MHQSATTARMLHKEPPPNPVASNNNCSVSLVALWITCNSAGPAEALRSWLWAFRLGCGLGFREPIGQASHLTWKPPGHVVCSVSHSGTWPKGQQLLKHALSRGPPERDGGPHHPHGPISGCLLDLVTTPTRPSPGAHVLCSIRGHRGVGTGPQISPCVRF